LTHLFVPKDMHNNLHDNTTTVPTSKRQFVRKQLFGQTELKVILSGQMKHDIILNISLYWQQSVFLSVYQNNRITQQSMDEHNSIQTSHTSFYTRQHTRGLNLAIPFQKVFANGRFIDS